MLHFTLEHRARAYTCKSGCDTIAGTVNDFTYQHNLHLTITNVILTGFCQFGHISNRRVKEIDGFIIICFNKVYLIFN